MQKIFHALFFAIVFLSSAVYGMETGSSTKHSQQEIPWYTMSFHDEVMCRIKNGEANRRGMFDVTLLFGACKLGYIEDIKLLLDAKVDVNAETYAGCIPLHVASERGNIETVKLLLAAGAYVGWKDCRGNTPLQRAQQKGHTEIAQLLQEQMARDALDRKKARLAKRRTW